MRKLILAGLTVAALSLTVLGPAEASGGCGPYRHRGWDGICRPGGQWGYPHRRVFYGGPVYFGHPHWGPGWRGRGPGWHHHRHW